ncbi:MAG: primosomal protein N' [Elusimicrobiota bacterium]|jgi:primosomal protein N' (replication factor Y)|nr:primosomal protein N' [Elusimicrobiota bacterium]
MKVIEVAIAVPLKTLFMYLAPENCSPESIVGKRVKVPFGNRKVIGYAIKVTESDANFKIKEILEVIDPISVIDKKTLSLADYICKEYVCSIGQALATIIPSQMFAPKRLAKPTAPHKIVINEIVLNQYQKNASFAISQTIKNNVFKPFLLFGVTASGKTEVYLHSIAEAVNANKQAIMLIPEISLTAQFVDIVKNRFGDLVGVWHSGITNMQKYKLFYGALNGGIKIMLGARSAIFAPFKNLGLIIIDEEHEHTYKQEQKPSYDARQIGWWLAKYFNAPLVLGSATPSLETYKLALEKKIELLPMPERIDKKRLPEIQVLSLDQAKTGGSFLLSETISALSQVLQKKQQAIVLLNRRGFCPSIICKDCQTVYQCPNCSISMVYHKHPHEIRCHYCGYKKSLPIVCPHCGSSHLAVIGAGTQKVEDELQNLFPQAKIFRLDADTAKASSNYQKAYYGIKNADYDILLGTQMIAKGFDFPNVTLVCIINADTSLYLPDFKSTERTFQLIMQVAGRCGRGKNAGKVLVQTRHPENFVIKSCVNYDYQAFYDWEMENRKLLIYPPFCDIAKIAIRNTDEERAAQEAKYYFDFLQKELTEKNLKLILLGPSPAYIAKLHNTYRQHIIIKGSKTEILKLAHFAADYKKTYADTHASIEISPADLI